MKSPQAISTSPPQGVRVDPRAILDQLLVGIIVADRSGRILYRNSISNELLPTADSLQVAFKALRFESHEDWHAQLNRVFSSGNGCCWTATSARDPLKSLHLQCTPFDGATAFGDAVILQIEARRHPDVGDEGTDVSRRLTSLGKLAARVAHELNNPLDGILRYINLAIRVASDAPQSRLTSYLSESRSGLLRMIRIISDLLEFSRNSDAGMEMVSVNELVEQSIRACSTAADASRVVVTADFQNDQMPQLRGGRLYQVCCNLIRNAIDAMPDGGRLSLTTGLVDDCIVLRVADTGVGLPDPAQKVFEPFYTTKQPGKGTGLGLAICKEFVEDLGGTIVAANGEGGGAVFTVRIPVAGLQPPKAITQSEPRP